jgi:hypothetical protein
MIEHVKNLSVQQDVTRLYDLGGGPASPDKNWKFVDGEAHPHFWYEDSLPTLVRNEKIITRYDEWYGDTYEDVVVSYTCAKCGEAVKPGYIHKNEAYYVRGRPSYHVDGVEVPKKDFDIELAKLIKDTP